MAHMHDEAVADEHLDLTELDHLFVGQVLRGLHHHEHRSFVHVELRSLVGLDRVLDGERMQPVLLAHDGELLVRRLVQSDPHERGLRVLATREVVEVEGFGPPPPILVERAVDDHRRHLRARQ